jgi:hypothetical protein
MLREQAEERSSGATMFKSGGAVLKRGYVWNETAMVATMYNLRMNNAAARLRLPPAVSEQRWRTAGAVGRRYFFDALAGAGSKTSAATSPAADAPAAAENSQT